MPPHSAMTDDELLQNLEDSTNNAADHQLQTLHSILQHQAAVGYLHPYLSGSELPLLDPATFRRQVPLSTYDDYADQINQMADKNPQSQPPFLSVDPLLCFFYSSGTSTLKPKLIPYFDSVLSRSASYLAHQSSAAILRKLVPPRPEVNKILWFLYADDVTTSRGGFKIMAASTFPFNSIPKDKFSQVLPCISPREVVFGRNFKHQMYCHLLCGLKNFALIDAIRAPYAVGLVRAFSMLESMWRQLCDDLENGFPSFEITDAEMRDSVVQVLGGPRVDLAERIRQIFEGKNCGGIVSKLWPNVRYVKCVTTGSMSQYFAKLRYYAGEVMILGGDYFASECTVGINLDIKQPPETTRYVMFPTAAYFEFLPFDSNENIAVVGDGTVDFSAVEVGKTYEVVATTHRGLYRYRLGDVVRVVGFHNSSPQVEFVMRAPKNSCEVITERDLMSAMESFQNVVRNAMAAEIVEFTCFFDLQSTPKQLKVFVEVEDVCERLSGSVEALEGCCSSLEKGLGSFYQVQRAKGDIGPLLVFFVRPGSFGRILEMAIKNGAPASQYKPPKIIRNPEIAGFMENSALAVVCLDSTERDDT